MVPMICLAIRPEIAFLWQISVHQQHSIEHSTYQAVLIALPPNSILLAFPVPYPLGGQSAAWVGDVRFGGQAP